MRDLLTTYEFPGDKTPIVIGSALKALEGDATDLGTKSVEKLVAEMDKYIPVPERLIDGPFLMPIEDVFSISGRGTVVTGRIDRGHREGRGRGGDRGLEADDEDHLHGRGDVQEAAGRRVARGTTWGCCCEARSVKRWSAGRCWRSRARSTPHTKFECEVYILTKEEGGGIRRSSRGIGRSFTSARRT